MQGDYKHKVSHLHLLHVSTTNSSRAVAQRAREAALADPEERVRAGDCTQRRSVLPGSKN